MRFTIFPPEGNEQHPVIRGVYLSAVNSEPWMVGQRIDEYAFVSLSDGYVARQYSYEGISGAVASMTYLGKLVVEDD